MRRSGIAVASLCLAMLVAGGGWAQAPAPSPLQPAPPEQLSPAAAQWWADISTLADG